MTAFSKNFFMKHLFLFFRNDNNNELSFCVLDHTNSLSTDYEIFVYNLTLSTWEGLAFTNLSAFWMTMSEKTLV